MELKSSLHEGIFACFPVSLVPMPYCPQFIRNGAIPAATRRNLLFFQEFFASLFRVIEVTCNIVD